MGTRANIIIIDSFEDKVIFYRHSDGYPSRTLFPLITFMKWIRDGKLRDNTSQSAGWLVILGYNEYSAGFDIDNNPSDWKVGAFEPTSQLSADTEFEYTLDLKNRTITIDNLDGEKLVITNFDNYQDKLKLYNVIHNNSLY